MNSPYFTLTITGEPFQLFSPSHLAALATLVVLACLIYQTREMWRQPDMNRHGRMLLAFVLVLSEILFQLWHLITHTWSVIYALPLQLCSISLILCVVMLVTRSYLLYEITYFWGMAGAMQAMLTPELFYPFPHFRYFHFFLAHIGIMLACLYMTWVEGYRPRFRSVWKSFLTLNLLLLIVIPVNMITGANYMFVAQKPSNPSLIDYLGPYPWYLLSLEGVAILVFTLLYLPFARTKQASSAHQHSVSP